MVTHSGGESKAQTVTMDALRVVDTRPKGDARSHGDSTIAFVRNSLKSFAR